MKIVLNTTEPLDAVRLKNKILQSIRKENEEIIIDAWTYQKSGDDYDIIYHNLSQYLTDPLKNVLFRVLIDGSNVVFLTAWWSKNPEPSHEMFSIHIGRLTEMLLLNFSADFIGFSIIEF